MSFRSLIAGVLLALFLFVSYEARTRFVALESRVRALEDARGSDAYRWLSEGVVTLPDGRRVSRAQLLDLLLSKALSPAKPDSAKR